MKLFIMAMLLAPLGIRGNPISPRDELAVSGIGQFFCYRSGDCSGDPEVQAQFDAGGTCVRINDCHSWRITGGCSVGHNEAYWGGGCSGRSNALFAAVNECRNVNTGHGWQSTTIGCS